MTLETVMEVTPATLATSSSVTALERPASRVGLLFGEEVGMDGEFFRGSDNREISVILPDILFAFFGG
jgi:hypothetical protein